jgi:hypothetical protein
VVQKAFAQDGSLSPAVRRSVLANITYVKGRVWLEADNPVEAERCFKEAVAMRPLLLKAHVFKILTSTPAIRGFLPGAVRRRLHLP